MILIQLVTELHCLEPTGSYFNLSRNSPRPNPKIPLWWVNFDLTICNNFGDTGEAFCRQVSQRQRP